MAHHAYHQGRTRGGWLPGPPLVRVLIVTVFGALVLLLVAPIWHMGGFATAHVQDDPAQAGEAVSNDLFTVVFHSAEIVADEGSELPRSILRVHADLTLHPREAERASTLAPLIAPQVEPGIGEPDSFDTLRLERRPERRVSWIQPAVTETVMLDWALNEEHGTAHDVTAQGEQVRLTILAAEYTPGFADQTERWRRTLNEDEAGQVVLALGEE